MYNWHNLNKYNWFNITCKNNAVPFIPVKLLKSMEVAKLLPILWSKVTQHFYKV